MKKNELINAISEKTGLTKKDVTTTVEATLEVIQEVLASGEKITIQGFGNFEVRERAARVGRNPQDPSQEVQIPAKKVPAWKPSKGLKDIVNQ